MVGGVYHCEGLPTNYSQREGRLEDGAGFEKVDACFMILGK